MTDRSQEGLLINLWDEDCYSGHSSSCSPVHSDQGRGLTPLGYQGATPATAHRFQNGAVWGRAHRKPGQYISELLNSTKHRGGHTLLCRGLCSSVTRPHPASGATLLTEKSPTSKPCSAEKQRLMKTKAEMKQDNIQEQRQGPQCPQIRLPQEHAEETGSSSRCPSTKLQASGSLSV